MAVIHNDKLKAAYQYFKPGDKIIVLYGIMRGQWGVVTDRKPRYIRNQWLREVKMMGTIHKKEFSYLTIEHFNKGVSNEQK